MPAQQNFCSSPIVLCSQRNCCGLEWSFNLTMRLYGPQSDALTRKWNLPVTRVQETAGQSAK
ncbi:MAG: hypothetical protein EKK35_04310 [Bradyrhizobiaceae bacterium]|nr:MAG: hypothetical protein EKK35_04310 [Bradyrhizobiaceae bacterium]